VFCHGSLFFSSFFLLRVGFGIGWCFLFPLLMGFATVGARARRAGGRAEGHGDGDCQGL
jgi:hypothetical protein